MTAIRPDMPAAMPGTGLTPAGGAAADAARAAFFRAAMGQVQATAAPARTAAAAPAASTIAPTVTASATRSEPSPDRPSRPGSLLDIRV
ncbi:hypothetical protein [uncultured Brevundimonas sp.]|mgnify:CR=1 FL=1|uniref:hypothetical protein n=1 Tax=uncultured Brevundimonas sp. TaxID=213418 RepID=UPI0030ED39FF|tara:strand:+ start:11910 stop:12176 length:267 start_codon:yes stop_codon:yes gene_type:complete